MKIKFNSKRKNKKRVEKMFFENTGKKYSYHSTIKIYGKTFYRFSIPNSKDGELVLMSEQGDIFNYDPDHWSY